LCGLRVITYTLSDVKRVCALIEREFTLAPQHTVDKAKLLAPAEFGYRSRHFVGQLSPTRNTLAEWKRFAGLFAEIQVRTVLEHAWAAIDHALRYKRDEDVPTEQKRTLFRLSALLELADEDFDKLKEWQEDLRQDAGRRLETGASDSPELDGVSYSVYAKSSRVLKQLMQMALQSGFEDAKNATALDDTSGETQSHLIARAKAQGLATVHDLDTVLKSEAKDAHTYFAALVSAAGDRGGWAVTPEFVALLCLIRTDPSTSESDLVHKYGWDLSIARRVLKVAAASRERGKV